LISKGHPDAQFYRFDFAEVVINELVKMNGGKVEEKPSDDNAEKMKGLFG
jgi:hypothetical protein